LIVPMAREIGERWRRGDLNAAQEHFFSAMARCFAWNLTRQYRIDDRAPKIVVGTPLGQLHDLGAMLVAATAANTGWRVTFVGANLPAFELAGAVRTVGACALALSICYPGDDSGLPLELEQLSAALPENIQVFVGGRASLDYFGALQRIGARTLGSLEELDSELDAMRRKSRLDV
jgi:methylmalonyl-CoA mutase cobalamin-binding subunit